MENPSNATKYLPAEMEYLTDEIIKKAETELGETNERRKTALEEFRALINEDHKLHVPTDDHYLLEFLRPRKFDPKQAMIRLQNFYNMKKNAKEVFGRKPYDMLIRVCQDNIVNMMPYRDEDGSVIYLIRCGNWNFREISFADMVHTVFVVITSCIDMHPATQICGMKLIFDTKNMGLNHFLHMSPKVLHVTSQSLSVCAPARIKQIHVINESVVIPYCWNIMKLVLSEKIRNRVFFHSKNMESLTNKINAQLLPEDLGGTLKYNNSSWIKFVQNRDAFYDRLMGYGY